MRKRKIIDVVIKTVVHGIDWNSSIERQVGEMIIAKTKETYAYSVKLEFYIEKSRLKALGVDNLSKKVLDILSRIKVFPDDRFVYNLEATKFPVAKEKLEETYIEVWEWAI